MVQKIIILLLLSICSSVFAQTTIPQLSIESGAQVSLGSYAPFMMSSNRYGVYGIDKNMGYVRVSIEKDTSNKFDYLYGFDAMGRIDKSNHLFIQQAYIGFKISNVILWGGTRDEVYGNQDRLLSSGGVLWSGNARPMPRIFLGTNDYINFPWTKGRVQVKAGISHGWFGERGQYVKDAYMHDKYFFGKIFIKDHVSFHFGLHHAAMWGGVSSDSAVGKIRATVKDFIKVFFIQSADAGEGPPGEAENKYGNHLASYQFGLDWSSSRFDFSLYMQTFLEDKNGRIDYHFDRKNRPDGLWGLGIKNKDKESFFRAFLFEYLHSTQQSGDPLKSGNDNYFNNYIYKSGWQYDGMTLGTPLITSPAYMKGNIADGHYLPNNKVIAFHIGIIGKLKRNFITLKNTFTLNYGTVDNPFDPVKIQNFAFIGYNYEFERYKNLFFTLETGFDIGKLIGNNVGIRCSIKKTF